MTPCARLFRELGKGLLDLVLPPVCAVCGDLLHGHDSLDVICPTCWSRIATLAHPRCERCGHPIGGGVRGECRWCRLLPDFVTSARSVCWATRGTGGDIVHALKYEGWTRIAEAVGSRIARLERQSEFECAAAIVPVPLTRTRLRERGFNQSSLIAAAVGKMWHLPVWDDVLVRVRETRSQTRLSPAARASNVSAAFAVPSGARARVSKAEIILMDDVITTGATINACAAALHAAGATGIRYFSFGRAPLPGE